MKRNYIFTTYGDVTHLENMFKVCRSMIYYAMRFQGASKKQRQIRSYAINKLGLPATINKLEVL